MVTEKHFYLFVSFLQDINKEETLLEKEQSNFPMLQTLISDKQPYEQLWNTVFNFQSLSEEWMKGRWLTLGKTTPILIISAKWLHS